MVLQAAPPFVMRQRRALLDLDAIPVLSRIIGPDSDAKGATWESNETKRAVAGMRVWIFSISFQFRGKKLHR